MVSFWIPLLTDMEPKARSGNEMMHLVFKLLDEEERFLILNTYSLGFSSLVVENMLRDFKDLHTGELFLKSTSGLKLPLGVFGRFCNTAK